METVLFKMSLHKGSPENPLEPKEILYSSSENHVKSKYFLPLFINFVISTNLGFYINLFPWINSSLLLLWVIIVAAVQGL